MGAEPLDRRLTVMISASMEKRIENQAKGRQPEFVRAALERALSGGRRFQGRRGKRGREIHRYGK
jgi:hypothetical protein